MTLLKFSNFDFHGGRAEPARLALAIGGILCVAGGLVVILACQFIQSAAFQAVAFYVSLVGWFVLSMGVTLLMRYRKARQLAKKEIG